jgi:ArsR family transcriptional regulator
MASADRQARRIPKHMQSIAKLQGVGHEELVAQLRAIAEPTRLRLMALLWASELTVSDLISILDQSQPRISRHLKLMANAGVLHRAQEGTRAFYRVSRGRAVAHVLAAAFENIDPDDPVFASDRKKLEAIRENRVRAAEAYFAANAASWDEIRALHLAEDEVERALLDIIGSASVDRFLDVGTGTGRMLAVLANHYDRALGIDSSAEMLAVARAKLDEAGVGNVEVRQGNLFELEQINAGGQQFDLAVMHMVLHFLENPGDALKAASAVLEPGGRLIIVDFAPHDFEFLRTAHNHVRSGFSKPDMQQMASEADMEVAQVRDLPPSGGVDQGLTVTIWALERIRNQGNPWI